MAFVKMKALSILALKKDKTQLLENLQRIGVLQIKEFQPDKKTELFSSILSSTKLDQLEDDKNFQEQNITLLDFLIPKCRDLLQVKPPIFASKKLVNFEQIKDYENWDLQLSVLESAKLLKEDLEEVDKIKLQLASLQVLDKSLKIWSEYDNFDRQINLKRIFTKLYRCENKQAFLKFEEEFKISPAAQEAVYKLVNPEILNSADKRDNLKSLYVFIVSTVKIKNKILSLAQKLALEDFNLPIIYDTIDDYIQDIKKQISEYQERLQFLQTEINALILELPRFELLSDYLRINIERLKATDNFLETSRFIYFEAYYPTQLEEELDFQLKSKFVLNIQYREITNLEAFPIAFKNFTLFAPYEAVTEMFSIPHAGEIDPTPTFAPFYCLFYGMMFSDIAYGLILSFISAFIIWGLKAKGEMSKLSKMLFQCGISSAIWGALFGGFFGNMLDVLMEKEEFFQALWFNPTNNPIKLIIISVIFGYFHIMMSLFVQMRILIGTGRKMDAFCDVFPWTLILTSGALAGARTVFNFIPLNLIYAFLILALAILMLMSGRPSYNPLVRIVKGLGALYGITAYISDLMSYTRILALCLATSVIAMVVNKIGFMGGKTVIGFIMFIVIALLGHSMNFALSALGAYIHTTRLQFVEFFGKFFEGGGTLYDPLRIKTEHVDVEALKFSTKKTLVSRLEERFNSFNNNL